MTSNTAYNTQDQGTCRVETIKAVFEFRGHRYEAVRFTRTTKAGYRVNPEFEGTRGIEIYPADTWAPPMIGYHHELGLMGAAAAAAIADVLAAEAADIPRDTAERFAALELDNAPRCVSANDNADLDISSARFANLDLN